MDGTFECVTKGCTKRHAVKGGRCPECGMPVMKPDQFRRAAWVKLGAGVLITAIMVPVLYAVVPPVIAGKTGFENALSSVLVLTALALLVLFGLVATVGAGLELRDRERQRWLLKAMLVLIALVLVLIGVMGALEPNANFGGRYG